MVQPLLVACNIRKCLSACSASVLLGSLSLFDSCTEMCLNVGIKSFEMIHIRLDYLYCRCTHDTVKLRVLSRVFWEAQQVNEKTF